MEFMLFKIVKSVGIIFFTFIFHGMLLIYVGVFGVDVYF